MSQPRLPIQPWTPTATLALLQPKTSRKTVGFEHGKLEVVLRLPGDQMTSLSERFRSGLSERYLIERELGAGGMATVYLASDLQRGRSVALKVLRPELASLIGPERFLREIEISGKLNHPHILPLFDSGEVEGLPYFVMPFIEGESLRDLLVREGQLAVEQALQITREVADALAYAHAQGFIHRDIKPENIMLSNGHALVADFGIARAVTAAGGANKLTGTGMAIGTVDYMSPEQATGSGQVDARGDLYSLACVLYEMLVGSPPFAASSAQAVIARHLVDPVPPIRTVRATVPVPVEAAILAALAKSRADRFATVKEFVEALEGRRPIPSLSHAAPLDPRASSRRRVLMLAGVGGLILVAGAAYLALRPPRLDDHRVLIGVFENRTGEPTLANLGTQAATEVASGLSSLDSVQAVDARSVSADSAAVRDLLALRRLARKEGAGSVVLGAYQRRGDRLEFEVQMTDATTGKVLRPLVPVAGPIAGSARVVAVLRSRVMAGYAAQFDPRFHDHTAVSQPTNYEAYREFQNGLTAGWTDADMALTHFRRAIALDSAFSTARIYAATGILSGSCPVVDSAAAALRAAGAHLFANDQAKLDYGVADCHPDHRVQYSAAQHLFRSAPGVPEYVYLVSTAALVSNNPREALKCRERLERTRDPADANVRMWCWNTMMHAHHQLGQYREALQLVDRIRAESPDDPLLERYQMRQWAALGDTGRINALIDDRIRKSNQGFMVSAGDDMIWVGEELRGHDHLAAGRTLCERAAVWYGARPPPEQRNRPFFRFQESVARASYCAERWDQARVAYTRMLDADSMGWNGIGFRTRLGALAARRGDTAEVTRIDQWLAARDTLPRASYGRAVLAGSRGDRARALGFFQFSWEREWNSFVTAHVDPALEPLRDYPPFRALLYASR